MHDVIIKFNGFICFSDSGDFSMADGLSSPCHSVSSTASSPLNLPVLKKRKLEGIEVELGDIGGSLGCVDNEEVVDEVGQFLLNNLGDVEVGAVKGMMEEEERTVKGVVEAKKVLVGNKLDEDAEELFCRQVAAELHRLTDRQKAEAKARIQQVFMEVKFPDTVP